MLVSIKEKSVYGKVLLYPNNDTAFKLANLIGKKTFCYLDLANIANLGYQVEFIKL